MSRGKSRSNAEKPVETQIPQASVAVPVCEPEAGSYIAGEVGRINTILDGAARENFRKVHAGLRASNATMSNGKPVVHCQDVVKYVFERLA